MEDIFCILIFTLFVIYIYFEIFNLFKPKKVEDVIFKFPIINQPDINITEEIIGEPIITIIKGIENDDYEIEYLDPSSEEPRPNPTYKLKHKTKDFNLEIRFIFRLYSSSFYSPTICWASHTELELIYNACTSKCKKKYEDEKLIERQRVIKLLKED